MGLEQVASLVRAQAWRGVGVPQLPPTQAAVLRMLGGPHARLRARDMSARLAISPASLSATLAAMEKRGWIERIPDPDDGRAMIVRLGHAGKPLAEQLRSPLHGIGALLEGLDDADVTALLRLTQLLVLQAQEQGLATGLRTCLGCRHFRPFASGQADKPHLCAFVGKPFGDAELRADCPDQTPAGQADLAANAARFRRKVPQ